MKKLIFLALTLASVLYGATFPLQLVDDEGQKVIIHKEPQRIAISGLWPMPSVIMMLSNSADKIIYMPQASKNALLHSFMVEIFPRISQIPAGNSENIEELLSYKPDVFICHSANKSVCASMRQSGVPTIAISVSAWKYDSYKTLQGWFRLIAPLLDREQKAQQILQEVLKQENLAKQNNEVLPKAIFIHTYASDEKLTIAGIFSKYLLKSSGGVAMLESNANTSLEEIYKLNPDIIYINNFTPLLPEQILRSKRWQGIAAVKNKRVYKLPLGSYRPFAPSVDLPVLLAWLRAHNEEFAKSSGDKKGVIRGVIKEDYKQYAKQYYKEMFGLKLDDVQLEKIFAPSSKAGNLQ